MSEPSFTHHRKVAFGDTDMAGIVHFSRLLDYVEEAEHTLFESVGVPCISSEVCWPRARVEADYRRPLRFGATAVVTLRLQARGGSSLRIEFEIRDAGGDGGAPCVTGQFIIVHARRAAGEESFQAAPVPGEFLTKLGIPGASSN